MSQSSTNETLKLSRDCEAYLIPAGTPIWLQKGTEVSIMQSLGGAYTVNIFGNLARIGNQDADALGKEVIKIKTKKKKLTEKELEELIWQQLKTCYDPEIPVNIVDLGLIYGCQLSKLRWHKYHIDIQMTLTAPGCGMGPVLAYDVQQKLLAIPNIKDVAIELVFDPPWDQSRMSETARLELGMFM